MVDLYPSAGGVRSFDQVKCSEGEEDGLSSPTAYDAMFAKRIIDCTMSIARATPNEKTRDHSSE